MIIRAALAAFLLVAVSLAMTACSSSDCDPGQTYRDGLCYPDPDATPVEASDAATDAADAGLPDAGAVDAAVEPFAHYGDVCEETGACGAPSNYCAIQPGDTVGYCTHTGCVEDETVCPGDWSCLDLSVFDPELPSICTPP